MFNFNKLPDECVELCRFKKCFQHGLDKGHFVQGRGYISYYDKPIHVCMTRLLSGCPEDYEINWDDLKSYFKDEINNSKCTKKARRLMTSLLNIIIDLEKCLVKKKDD